MASKKKMTKEENEQLACRDYWTVEQFSYLLAGRGIDTSKRHEDFSNDARAEIESAISVGNLAVIPGPNSNDLTYGLQRIRPTDAIKWAQSKPKVWRFHKTFPLFDLSQIDPTTSDSIKNNTDVNNASSEIDKLFRLAGAMAFTFAKEKTKLDLNGRPNVSQIATEIITALDKLPDSQRGGLGSSNMRDLISEGLKRLHK